MAVKVVTLATITNADADAVRSIWNQTRTALGAFYPGGINQLTNRNQAKALLQRLTLRLWLDNTNTVHGLLLTQPLDVGSAPAEQATVLFPRPSISPTLFDLVCKELLEHWFNDCIARGVPHCWGVYPKTTPPLMLSVFNRMASVNGAVATEHNALMMRWVITPEQGLLGLTAL